MKLNEIKCGESLWWLCSMDGSGFVEFQDGPHSDKSGAEQALTLRKRLGFHDKKLVYSIVEVKMFRPAGEHEPLNEEVI